MLTKQSGFTGDLITCTLETSVGELIEYLKKEGYKEFDILDINNPNTFQVKWIKSEETK